MPIRSMTGFAQVKGELKSPAQTRAATSPRGSDAAAANGSLAFSLSLKSVNHRFLDLHFRLPSGGDSLEMQLRRLLKEKMARGHVEVTLSLDRGVQRILCSESRTGGRIHRGVSRRGERVWPCRRNPT